MSAYDLMMKPLEKRAISKMRSKYISRAYGHVVELGSGTGVNLKYYNMSQVNRLHMTDIKINNALKKKTKAFDQVKMIQVDAEKLPYEDHSVDTVVATLLYCSVVDVQSSLNEIKRILKPAGRLIFIEHVLPHDESLAKVFNVVTPVWKHVANGCHLNRVFKDSLLKAGFKVTDSMLDKRGIFYSGEATV